MEFIINDLSLFNWIILTVSALLIGMSKTGISGAGMVSIPLMAIVYGGRLSSGVVLPMLCMADMMAVLYYHQHASWKHVYRLLPWALAGILTGVYVGDIIPDQLFKDIMGVTVIISAGILAWRDFNKNSTVPNSYLFPVIIGFAGGFTTMVGNAAGAIMTLYLLSMHLPKNEYIGTGAWFFLIVNLAKVPFHIFIWDSITLKTFLVNVYMLPALGIGAIAGVYLVKLFTEKIYRIILLLTTIIAAILMVY